MANELIFLIRPLAQRPASQSFDAQDAGYVIKNHDHAREVQAPSSPAGQLVAMASKASSRAGRTHATNV